MAETSERKIAKLTRDFGGYKQIAFWNTFVRVIFGIHLTIIIVGMLVGIGFGVSMILDRDDYITLEGIIIAAGCAGGGLILIFVQYMMLMLKQLLLSYLYDVKQQSITLENLTLMEGGEVLNNPNLAAFATRTALKSMNINSSDVMK